MNNSWTFRLEGSLLKTNINLIIIFKDLMYSFLLAKCCDQDKEPANS